MVSLQTWQEKSTVERPLLTQERKEHRVEWANRRLQQLIADDEVFYCFLDEKWFYCRNRRKKVKFLPPQPGEKSYHIDEMNKSVLRVISRRFPTKVMYMGVVSKPDPAHNFDGKIELLRVSEEREYKRNAYLENAFSHDLNTNDAVKNEWRSIAFDEMKCDVLLRGVADHFDLDEDVAGNLALRYKKKGRWTLVPKDLPYGEFKTFSDLTLQVFRAAGTKYMADTTCDSGFMRTHMLAIGEKIRSKMPWVPPEKPIYLVMDNAGGHGTKDAIDEYVEDLKDTHNVVIIWQIPRSPETNLLDLGIWNSLQSLVDKSFRGNKQDVKALAKTVQLAWDLYCTPAVFQRVYDRWEKVLRLIIAGAGDNIHIDSARGENFVPIVLGPPQDDEEDAADGEDIDSDNESSDSAED